MSSIFLGGRMKNTINLSRIFEACIANTNAELELQFPELSDLPTSETVGSVLKFLSDFELLNDRIVIDVNTSDLVQ